MNGKEKEDSPPSQNTRSHDDLKRPALRSNTTPRVPFGSPGSRRYNVNRDVTDGNSSDTTELDRSADMSDTSFVSISSSSMSGDQSPKSLDSATRKRKAAGAQTPRDKPTVSPKPTKSLRPGVGDQVPKGGKQASSPLKAGKPGKPKEKYIYLYIFLIITVVGLGIFCFSKASQNGENEAQPKPVDSDYFKRFKPEFDYLKSQFPAQTPRFWQVLGTQIKRVLTETPPTYPAVVLIGVPLGHSKTASCLSKKLISSLNDVFNVNSEFYINSAILNQASPAKTKLDLDERLIEILSKSRGIVLDTMDELPAEGALLLHGYCDGDNAPNKDVVIVQVLNTGMAREELTEWAVENKLNDLWEEELGADEMPAFRSRIANNIIILNPEQNFVCETK